MNPAAPINAQSMLSAAVMAMGMGGLTGGGSRGNSDAGGSSGAQLTDQFAQQENIVDDVSASGSLDLTRNTGQLKLDAVTSCVLEQVRAPLPLIPSKPKIENKKVTGPLSVH